jgi:hypothetical protein
MATKNDIFELPLLPDAIFNCNPMLMCSASAGFFESNDRENRSDLCFRFFQLKLLPAYRMRPKRFNRTLMLRGFFAPISSLENQCLPLEQVKYERNKFLMVSLGGSWRKCDQMLSERRLLGSNVAAPVIDQPVVKRETLLKSARAHYRIYTRQKVRKVEGCRSVLTSWDVEG